MGADWRRIDAPTRARPNKPIIGFAGMDCGLVDARVVGMSRALLAHSRGQRIPVSQGTSTFEYAPAVTPVFISWHDMPAWAVTTYLPGGTATR